MVATKFDQEARYRQALKSAQEDLQALLSEQEDLAKREEDLKTKISALRRVVAGLSEFCGVAAPNWMGITEAVTQVMDEARDPLETRQVIDRMSQMGWDMSSQKNAPASVTSVLNRLASKDKIRKVLIEGGTFWFGPKVEGPPPTAGGK